jgi:hypothetical protein
MGSHSINLSYDERGRSMLSTIGMASWDVDLMQSGDCVSAIMDRARSAAQYYRARQNALPLIQELRQITVHGLQTLRTLASEQ